MSKLTDLFKDVAPTIAGVLGTAVSGGNPAVGIGLKMLSEKLLGHPAGTQDQVAEAVSKLDQDKLLVLEVTMKELGFKTEELYVKDAEDARNMYIQTKNPLTNWIAGGLVMSCVLLVASIVTGYAVGLKDPTMAATGGTVVGYMFRELKHVLGFFFGKLGKDE